MAPLDDLIHAFLIALKNGLYTAIPAVLNPTLYPQSKSHLLSVMAKEDSLDPPFNDYTCPHFFHIDLETTTGSSQNQWSIRLDGEKLNLKSRIGID
jgi:hypothetical protein